MAFAVKFFLDEPTHAKAIKTTELLQTHGPALPPPYSKKLASRLYELRTSGQIAVRILYANHQGTYYLLHAFKKRTQKTPPKELQTALDRRAKLI